MNDYNLSERGLEMIKSLEGLRLTAYKCAAGVWTIGYGHTAGVRAGMTISKGQAEDLLMKDLEPIVKHVRLYNGLTQGMFDALVSFIFNVGMGAWLDSTIRKEVIKNPWSANVGYQMLRWVHVKGVIINGLVMRRERERRFYYENQ